jgi:hypothetical protein
VCENSPQKIVQRKMPGKKFAQALRQRKKIVQVIKQQCANSLEKKFLQRHETGKKNRAAKCIPPPPPGISNGPPLIAGMLLDLAEMNERLNEFRQHQYTQQFAAMRQQNRQNFNIKAQLIDSLTININYTNNY